MAIAEFPHLRIDDFRINEDSPLPKLCILSHMHEDHTIGLARKSYFGPTVYCTAATKAMVLNFRSNYGRGPLKYNHLRKEIGGKEILQSLELNKPYELEYGTSCLRVTLIDANHCPGAAMVLVQSPHNSGPSVLFTGDVRCERWHLNSLTHNPALFVYSKHLCDGPGRKWLSLYVDDTFLSHMDPFKAYNENHDGILHLVSLLKQYPEEVHFCLADRTTGYEEVLIALAQQLHTKVHMDSYFFSIYSAASSTSPLAAKLLEVSSTELGPAGSSRIHYCHKDNGCPMRDAQAPTAYFKPCNQPSEEQIYLQNMQLPFSSVRPSALRPFEESESIFLGPDQRYYKDTRTQKFYPLFPWFYFSRHSSFPEIQGLCDLFHVTTVRSLRGVEIPSLALPSAASLKRSLSMSENLTASHFSSKPSTSMAGVSGVVPAGKAASLNSATLPVYKKQDHNRTKRRRRMRRSSGDDDTDADESERHQVLELLNRRSLREESKQKWRDSILEREKQRESNCDTQEFDDLEIARSLQDVLPPQDGEYLPAIADGGHLALQSENIHIELDKERGSVPDPDSSSLPSPPMSPSESSLLNKAFDLSSNKAQSHIDGSSKLESKIVLNEASDSCHVQESVDDGDIDDIHSIDETPTTESLLASLEHQIREDPSCWFSFTFDFAN